MNTTATNLVYRYFVSFNHITHGTMGIGNLEIHLRNLVRNMDDVNAITAVICNEGYQNVVVLSFCLFSPTTPQAPKPAAPQRAS